MQWPERIKQWSQDFIGCQQCEQRKWKHYWSKKSKNSNWRLRYGIKLYWCHHSFTFAFNHISIIKQVKYPLSSSNKLNTHYTHETILSSKEREWEIHWISFMRPQIHYSLFYTCFLVQKINMDELQQKGHHALQSMAFTILWQKIRRGRVKSEYGFPWLYPEISHHSSCVF